MSSALHEELERRRIVFRCGRRAIFVAPGDVVRISGEGNYSRLHLRSGKGFLVRDSISSLQEQLAPFGMWRVHRSHLVRLEDVVEVRRSSRYAMNVLLSDGTRVPLAEGYRRGLEGALLLTD